MPRDLVILLLPPLTTDTHHLLGLYCAGTQAQGHMHTWQALTHKPCGLVPHGWNCFGYLGSFLLP